MKSLFLSIMPLFIILFVRCGQRGSQSDLENTLSATISRFPQLPRGKDKQSSFYRLVRSVTIGENDVEMQLRSAPDSLDDSQKIIVLINRAKIIYVIPFFSNTYHDYWSFQFDSVLSSVRSTNTTFERELKTCLSQLNFYDTLGTAGKVIHEMFFSLLQCQQVTDADSTDFLHSFVLTNNYILPYEDSDSCTKRTHENWQEMKKAFHPADYIVNCNAYWDKTNNRVYQFDFQNFNRKRKLQFSIKNYRLDCIFQMLNM